MFTSRTARTVLSITNRRADRFTANAANGPDGSYPAVRSSMDRSLLPVKAPADAAIVASGAAFV
ncbi:hypothetical protein Acsp04_61310 [Actinomadura sp. NBRC 104425]|nr:hypothetical protein Acsp04_61310 [Actinomadura sp. NBRC 104425]